MKSFDDTFCIYISCFTGNRIVRNACKADIGSRHPAALRRRRCADKDYSAPSYTDDTLHRKRLALSPLGPLKCKQSKITLRTSHKKPRILKNKKTVYMYYNFDEMKSIVVLNFSSALHKTTSDIHKVYIHIYFH